jgi:diadenosine tetraphosphate (Ap4A) HIT family hydrolase
MSCALCDRVKLTINDKYPYLIHEFKNSYLYLGEHQFYRGYCVLVTKDHYKEMTNIPDGKREEVFAEMMTASKLIEKTFSPTKMNMCSLGNVVPHVHWHFFPRYISDADFKNPPWLQMHLFDSVKIGPTERDELIEMLKVNLKSL